LDLAGDERIVRLEQRTQEIESNFCWSNSVSALIKVICPLVRRSDCCMVGKT
jgi:hypothetical protein